jgi:hypothetical protein
VPLFWLTYRHPDGRAAGVVVVDSPDLLQAGSKLPSTASIAVSISSQGTSLIRRV